jgi:hypothetical protein
MQDDTIPIALFVCVACVAMLLISSITIYNIAEMRVLQANSIILEKGLSK